MRKIFLLGLIFWVITLGFVYANSVGGQTEMKIKSDLDESLAKLVPRESYVVQVFATVDNIQEKQLVEGETIVQNNPTTEINVPPLPGFDPSPQQPHQQPPSQNRQLYRMVEKEILKSVRAEVTLNETLDPTVVTQVKNQITNYLKANYGNKAFAVFNIVKMLPSQASSTQESLQGRQHIPFDLRTALAIGSMALLFLTLITLLLIKGRAPPRVVYPTVMQPNEQEIHAELVQKSKPLALPSGTSQSKGEFPALPTTQDFVDRRSELLEAFLKNAETFRLYYTKLPEASQSELYAGLRGPAFESLLDALGLPRPKSSENLTPPSEEQMLFYEKNFSEFVQTQSWENHQFFGFLHQLTNDQILSLVHQKDTIVSALIIKFLKPEQAAVILKALTSKERTNILKHFSEIKELTTEELISIESSVRDRGSKLPNFLLDYSKGDTDFWSKILSQAEDQEEILTDLEKFRPDLYAALAKFRFKLEDLPSLPEPLINRVLSEVDNEQLSQALASCSKNVVEFVLSKLNSKRSELISSQLQMYSDMSTEDLNKAKLALTLRFRKEIT